MIGVSEQTRNLVIWLIFGLVILAVAIGLAVGFREIKIPNIGGVEESLDFMWKIIQQKK